MDLTAVDVTDADVAEGDWLPLDFDLAALSTACGLSQYELLVALSPRYERLWS
jgi:alanine racemase